MPDPWLVDGKPHPAVEVIGSWEESERTSACVQDGTAGNGWWIRYRTEFASGESHIWYVSITSRVAHALLEKQAREWLAERHVDIELDMRQHVPRQWFWVKQGCGGQAHGPFASYPAAQQAAILAEGSE